MQLVVGRLGKASNRVGAHAGPQEQHDAGPGCAPRARPAPPDDFEAYQLRPSAGCRQPAGAPVNPDDAGPPPPESSVLLVAGHPFGPAPRGLAIPVAELAWRFSGAGGPGGQHVNTSNTRAEVRFDLAGSPSVPEAARPLLLARLGPSVAVAAADTRSQVRNRDLALGRLADKLAAALVVERPRRPTRPTRASQRRRLDDKRRQGDRKRDRRVTGDE